MPGRDIIRRLFAFRTWLAIAAGVLPACLVVIFGFLLIYAWPAIGYNGLDFITKSNWDTGDVYSAPVMHHGVLAPPGAQFNVFFLEGGTILTVLVAIFIAYPIGVAAAVFLAEVVPNA